MRTMHSMELSDDEILDFASPVTLPEKPKFPYGLRITLTEAELEKLKLDPDDAQVGATFHGWFMARVTAVSKTEDQDGKECCRIEAQIEDLGIESEDAENES